ncbi:oxygenase MpaB family protein [Streptomyces parvulus]|nr:oxygenase MpaB family protein [Streptomyces parvulus]
MHGHATGMLIGGFTALMPQSLHPLAMAGVDQHSDFRADPVGD